MKSRAPLNIIASLLFAWACYAALIGKSFFFKMQNYIAQYYNPISPDAVENATEASYKTMQVASSIGSVFSISLLVLFPFILSLLMFKRKKLILSKVFAFLTCIGFPIGTVLGIVSLVALSRKNTKSQYNIR